MTPSWCGTLAVATATVTVTAAGVMVGAPGIAQAQSVSYVCEYVSPVFFGPQEPHSSAPG